MARDTVRGEVRTVSTLARWRARRLLRSIVHEIRDTLPGKIFVLFVLFAIPTVITMVRNGFGELPVERNALGGYLVVVHWLFPVLAACYASMLFAKHFVVQTESDPLRSHPALLPALARQNALLIFATILEITLLAYAFFGKGLASAFERPLIGLSVHVATSTVVVVTLTAVAIGLTRRSLARTPEAGKTWYLASGMGGLVVLAAFMAVPMGMADTAPGTLAAIGDAADRAYYLGAVPLLTAHAASSGEWATVISTLSVLTLLAVPAVRHVRELAVLAPLEFPIDAAAPSRVRYASLYTTRALARRARSLRAFWYKDVVARATRERHGAVYLLEQTGVLWIAGTIVIAAGILAGDGAIDPTWAAGAAYGALVYTGGALAFVRGLSWLGEEGDRIALLRPAMSGAILFAAKGGANALYVAGHTVIHAVLLFVAARAIGIVDIGLASFLAHAVGIALLLLYTALVLGLLLPDLRRRSSFLPGASNAGKYLFGGVAMMALGTVVITRVLIAPVATSLSYAGFILGVTVPFVVIVTGLLVWALHRFNRLET